MDKKRERSDEDALAMKFVQLKVTLRRAEAIEAAMRSVETPTRIQYFLDGEQIYRTLIHLSREGCRLYSESQDGSRTEIVIPRLYDLACASRDKSNKP